MGRRQRRVVAQHRAARSLSARSVLAKGSRKNNLHLRIPDARHLRPLLGRKILEIRAVLLRFRSVVAAEADARLGANLTSYSCASPNEDVIAPLSLKRPVAADLQIVG